MKKVILTLVVLFYVISAHAEGPGFNRAECGSYDGTHTVSAIKKACTDIRYEEWNSDGCYQIKVVDRGQTVFNQEILRDGLHWEDVTGTYTLYSYDEDEWILIGMILSIRTNSEGHHVFRFDQRGNSKEEMVTRTEGGCDLY